MHGSFSIRSRAKGDLRVVAGVVLACLALAHLLDLSEAWHAWAEAHEAWEVDEIPLVLGLSAGAIAWFSFRRWQDYRAQFDWAAKLNQVLVDEIEERERAESLLRESEERLSGIVAHSPASIVLKDPSGRFQLINETFKKRYGKPLSEIIGKTDYDLHPKDVADLYAQHDREVIDSGRACIREFPITFADGSLRTVVVTKFPVRNWQGDITGIGSISADVTEQRIAEQRLHQAQKMEAVGLLTGGVAHDFNNLLAVIQGNAEMIGDRLGLDDPPLQGVIRAATRGAELTNRLLAFSRRQPLKPQSIDLDDLVDGMLDLLSRTLGATVEIATSVTAGTSRAVADPGQIENAILNLAINARDAMPQGGKLTIEVTNVTLDADSAAQAEVPAGDYLLVAVSDTGTGMTPEVLEHAFEPFFTTKKVGQGSGLGLSMVYGFAKQSGGNVTIYSEPGQGTTVKLYLPRAAQHPRTQQSEAAEEVPTGSGEKILVIEDDKDVRSLAATMLEGLGYRVIEAPEAASARQALERDKIDLILSDVVLPGGTSGPEFAAEAMDCCPDLPIIFMSGYAAEAAKRNGLLTSDRVLLNKPFRRRELAKTIREALVKVPRIAVPDPTPTRGA